MNSQVCEVESIAECSNVQVLIDRLKGCASQFLNNIAEMAAIVRRLDDLGAKVDLDNTILPYIRMIAHEQLSPDCFVALCGDTRFLDRVCGLPKPLQEKIASGETFRVMELGGDCRMVSALEMNANERRQVFDKHRLRTDSEQIGWLREKMQRSQAKAPPPSPRPISIDRKRKGLIVGELFIPLSELAGYVSSLSQ